MPVASTRRRRPRPPDGGGVSPPAHRTRSVQIHTVLTAIDFNSRAPRSGWSVGDIQQLLVSHARFRATPSTGPVPNTGSSIALTRFTHLWTNGQVEWMSTLKDATVPHFYYAIDESLRAHVATFFDVYNFAKRLNRLRGLTPFERICSSAQSTPNDSD